MKNMTEPLFGLGKQSSDTEHFNGEVYVNEILDFDYPMLADIVTFAPGVRNNWHIHQAGQILMVTDGTGWYQEEGKNAIPLKKGSIVKIPAGVKHWHGASVNCVCPGWVATDMNKELPQELLDYQTSKTCKGRMAKPEEVAKLVAFLASDDAEFIDGEVIKIDGGYKLM